MREEVNNNGGLSEIGAGRVVRTKALVEKIARVKPVYVIMIQCHKKLFLLES